MENPAQGHGFHLQMKLNLLFDLVSSWNKLNEMFQFKCCEMVLFITERQVALLSDFVWPHVGISTCENLQSKVDSGLVVRKMARVWSSHA